MVSRAVWLTSWSSSSQFSQTSLSAGLTVTDSTGAWLVTVALSSVALILVFSSFSCGGLTSELLRPDLFTLVGLLLTTPLLVDVVAGGCLTLAAAAADDDDGDDGDLFLSDFDLVLLFDEDEDEDDDDFSVSWSGTGT